MSQPDEDRRTEFGCLLQKVRGFTYPGSRWFYKKNLEDAMDFQPRDTDIFINSYPKCGTHWVTYMVHSIITRGQRPMQSSAQLTYELVPFLDISGTVAAENLPDPRPFQYHLPYSLIPKNPRAKYIYLFRNPKDAVVSYYHFTMQIDEVQLDFNDYFDAFMKGLVSYGDYFDHVLSWYEHRNDPNVLFVTYEQIHADTAGQVLRIAKFLGQSYHDALQGSKPLMQLILKQISFDEMKKFLTKEATGKKEVEVLDTPAGAAGPRYAVDHIQFLRKGVVGDRKNHLSPEQDSRMEQRLAEKFGNTDIMKMFNP